MDQAEPSRPVRQHHAPTHLPDVSTLPGASTHTTGSPCGARGCAHACGPRCARPWALAKVREPSHPHLAPDTERCHVFTDSGDLAWVSCPSPLPAPGLPTWRPARPGPWVWSHRKGPWANSSPPRPGDNAVSVQSKFSRYHGAQKDWALPRRALQLQVAPRLFSLGG